MFKIEIVNGAIVITDIENNIVRGYPPNKVRYIIENDDIFTISAIDNGTWLYFTGPFSSFIGASDIPFESVEEIQELISSVTEVFDGQLVQNGDAVSEENPLPVSVINQIELEKIFYTEDVEEDSSTNITYVGKQTKEGEWKIQKILEETIQTITTTSILYASVVNNPSIASYEDAWADRATLTYSEIKDLI